MISIHRPMEMELIGMGGQMMDSCIHEFSGWDMSGVWDEMGSDGWMWSIVSENEGDA